MADSTAHQTRLFLAEIAVVGISLAVRVGALSLFEAAPEADHPMVDAFTYWQQAQQLLSGMSPFAEGYYQPPAYPVLLSWVGQLAGGLELPLIRKLHLALGVCTTAAVVALGRPLGRALSLPFVGVVAGLFFALGAPPILFEHDVLTPTVTLASSTVGMLALVHALDQRGILRVALSAVGGLLVGLAVAVHPTYLLAALVVLLGLVAGGRDRAALAVVFGVGVAAPIVPTTIENARRFSVFAPVSHNAGLNLYLGNNAHMRDTVFLRPGLPFRQLILEADPASRNVAERNAYWVDRTRSEVAEAPVVWLSVLATKAVWSVNRVEVPRNEDYRCRTRAGGVLSVLGASPVGFGLLFPLALVGAGTVASRRDRWAWMVPVWVALHAPMVLFLVSSRYRLATWPVLVLMAGVGAVSLISRGRPRPWLLGLLLGGAVLAHLPIDPRTALDPAWCDYQEANRAFTEGDLEQAQDLYAGVVTQPGWERDLGAHYWLGRLAEKRRDPEAAAVHFDVVLAGYPDHFPTLKARADAAYYSGDKAGAADFLKRAYAVPGNRTNTGVKLVKLLRSLGRDAEAEAILAEDAVLAAHPKLQ